MTAADPNAGAVLVPARCDCICGCRRTYTCVGDPIPHTAGTLCVACWQRNYDKDPRHQPKPATTL
jgi:hypothetical protein